jgi:hypothetical protein
MVTILYPDIHTNICTTCAISICKADSAGLRTPAFNINIRIVSFMTETAVRLDKIVEH